MRKPTPILACSLAVATILCGSVCCGLASCVAKAKVDVKIVDLSDCSVCDETCLRCHAKYLQFAVFEGDCPAFQSLAQGNLQGATVWTVENNGEMPSDLIDLPKNDYGFAALLRRDDCGVVGYGCTKVELEKHRHVEIRLAKVDGAPGACDATKGQVCENGTCSTAAAEAGVDAGKSCNLAQPVAFGTFGNTTVANAYITGPAVVGTPSGFVAAYAESSGGSSSLTVQPISATGTKGTAQSVKISGCGAGAVPAGLAMAWNTASSTGLLALSTLTCSETETGPGALPRINTYSFDQSGKVSNSDALTFNPPDPVTLVSSAGATPATTPGVFRVAGIENDVPVVYRFNGTSLDTTQVDWPTQQTSGTFVHVASTSQIFAAVADKLLGTDAGTELWVAMGPGDSFGKSIPIGSVASPTMASIAALGSRAMVVAQANNVLHWWLQDQSNTTVPRGTGTISGAPYSEVGIVGVGDSFVVFAAKLQSIVMYRFTNASGTIQANPTANLLPNDKITEFGGKKMSVASVDNTHIAVTWINKDTFATTGTSPGGYAVLQCND
jgi:hypothetical protein